MAKNLRPIYGGAIVPPTATPSSFINDLSLTKEGLCWSWKLGIYEVGYRQSDLVVGNSCGPLLIGKWILLYGVP